MNPVARSFLHRISRRVLVSALTCALVGSALLSLTLTMSAQQPSGPRATVRHGFTLNGRIEGSVQQLTGENTTLNGGGTITGDLLVPGTPTVRQNGHPSFGGVAQGSGNAQPANYQITLNGNAQLGRLLTRTDPVSMPVVQNPPAATGTRDVTLNSAGQSAGDFATVRDLTLNGNVGAIAVPPGTYRRLTANGAGRFVLGVAGASQPSVYNLNSLTLNGGSRLELVGPVILTTATAVTLNAAMGSESHPLWLSLKVATGGVTLNGGSALYGLVAAPAGTVTINGNSRLVGNVSCDRLTVNGNGVLRIVQGDTAPPLITIEQPSNGAITNAPQVSVTGTYNDDSATTITVNGVAATVSGNSFTASVPLNEGSNTLRALAVDTAGNTSEAARTIIRDTTGPLLVVEQPADNGFTNASEITIAGSVSDATLTSVTVNNAPAPLTDGHFNLILPLTNDGPTNLTIRAADAAGNQSVVNRRVTRDTVAPALTLTSPIEGQIARNLSVAGTATDALPITVNINGVELNPGAGGAFSNQFEISEGVQQIRAQAIDAAGNVTEIRRSVNIDVTPPTISELSPAEGGTVDSPATVHGRIEDATTATVKVNNSPASVDANGLFSASIAIAEGENQIQIAALDAAGNESAATLLLVGRDRNPPAAPSLFPVTTPTRLAFQTIEGGAESGATLTINGGAEPVTANAAFGNGHFVANVKLAPGVNALTVVARDAEGNVSPATQVSITSDPNLALPPAGQPAHINISIGNTQKGLVGTELPRPLIAIVTDSAGAPVAGVSVRFTIQEGGGQFIGSSQSVEALTNEQGHASARYVSGATPGLQQIRADFNGNTLTPVIFIADALEAPAGAETTVSGNVLDQNLRGLPNVLVRIGGQQARTTADGSFLVRNVPSGPHKLLELIGRDQITLPGRWPNITYDMDVLPGIDNQLGRPLFLPRVNDGIAFPLDANGVVAQDTTYELPVVGGEPPIRLTARAGTRITFPPDATDKRFSVTRIATNRVPMTLEDGRATNLYITVQPSGAIFEPPLAVSFPNLDRLPPNSEVLLMSFDHDAGRYLKAGTGHVSADGRTVNSDPGNGIRIGAWGALPPDPPQPEVTVLSHIQIAGNPAFENKTITQLDAWSEGVRAVLNPPVESIEGASRVEAIVTLSLPEGAAKSATVEALAKTGEIKFQPTEVFVGVNGTVEVTATIDPAPTGTGTWTWKSDDTATATVTPATDPSYPSKVTVKGIKQGKTKLKVEYKDNTDPKIKFKGEVKVNVGTVKYEKTQDCAGFDDTQKTAGGDKIYWLVVGENKSNNIVKADIEPDKDAPKVSFTSASTGTATVVPARAAADKQVLTVTGVAHGTTHIQPKFDTTDTDEKLNVAVKKKKTVRVTFNYVSDNANHRTRRSQAEAADFIRRLNEIWGPQANVDFVLNQTRNIVVNQNLGDTIDLIECGGTVVANCNMRSPEVVAIISQADRTADHNVYFVWETEWNPTKAGEELAAFAATPGTDLLFEDDTGGEVGQVISHETGHNFGLGHHNNLNELRFLMYRTTDGGCFIPKAEADVANP